MCFENALRKHLIPAVGGVNLHVWIKGPYSDSSPKQRGKNIPKVQIPPVLGQRT